MPPIRSTGPTVSFRFPAGLALAVAASSALAAEPVDLQAVRQEIAALRAAYEARLQALEERLKAAETKAAEAQAAPPAPAPAPAPVVATPAAGPLLSTSLILSGQFNASSRDPASYRIGGVALPPDAELGLGRRSFNLGESELGFTANVDPWWRGVANISVHGDDSLSVEEAYVQTTALDNGFNITAGRFFSGIGYLNSQHAHVWDFADAPLAYQALLGTQFNDDGMQIKWLAPTDQFLELGAELGRGRGFPGSDVDRNGAGAWSLFAHTGGDIGDSQSWRAGLSLLNAKARDQGLRLPQADGSLVDAAFTGRNRVWVADAVWKWAPNGNATRTYFKLQGEWLRATQAGELGGADFRARTSGGYVQAVYQFMPAWRLGLRTERLSSAGLAETFAPRKTSLMLDWSPSEFSRIRLQTAQDRAQPGSADREWVLQYQMSLGAHGAHSY